MLPFRFYSLITSSQCSPLVVSRKGRLQACKASSRCQVDEAEGQNGRLKTQAEVDTPGEEVGGVSELFFERDPVLGQLLLDIGKGWLGIANEAEMDTCFVGVSIKRVS